MNEPCSLSVEDTNLRLTLEAILLAPPHGFAAANEYGAITIRGTNTKKETCRIIMVPNFPKSVYSFKGQ
jgi:hypothetical protein